MTIEELPAIDSPDFDAALIELIRGEVLSAWRRLQTEWFATAGVDQEPGVVEAR